LQRISSFLSDCPEPFGGVPSAIGRRTTIGNGGLLVIEATRDRRLRRWVFGSTPDRTIDFARSSNIPVLIHASTSGVSGRIEEYLFPIYRYLRRHLGERRAFRHIIETHSETE
jgi:hypothetical protein